jgi:hypothetical protein
MAAADSFETFVAIYHINHVPANRNQKHQEDV